MLVMRVFPAQRQCHLRLPDDVMYMTLYQKTLPMEADFHHFIFSKSDLIIIPIL